jgi:hypothetical protein
MLFILILLTIVIGYCIAVELKDVAGCMKFHMFIHLDHSSFMHLIIIIFVCHYHFILGWVVFTREDDRYCISVVEIKSYFIFHASPSSNILVFTQFSSI